MSSSYQLLMAELDDVLEVAGQLLEEACEAGQILVQARRQLEQDRAQRLRRGGGRGR